FRLEAARPGHDGAGGRSSRAGLDLAAEVERAVGAAGQADGAGDAVVVRGGVQRAKDTEGVRDLGELREQLTNADARDVGGDRCERAAEFEGGVRLGVPRIELSRAAP